MGVVYLARDIGLNMQVAIKALKPSIAGDAEHRRRLKHEAQLMAQLAGHPNIATVHALIDEGDAFYIVEECLPGPTLRERLADGPLSVADATAVGLAVLHALGAAHRQRIRAPRSEARERDADVHRQLEGARLRHRQGRGARPADDAERHGRGSQRVGTPQYMSPEQLRGEPLDGRSDLFAFGVLLYELLTGRHPFAHPRDSGALATWTAVLHDPPQPFKEEELARLPPGLPEVIARCLEKDPARRWSSAEDAEAALEAIDRGRMPAVMTAPAGNAVSWWQFHEGLAAVVYWLTLIPMWHVRPWIGRSEWHVGGLTLVLDVRTLFLVLRSPRLPCSRCCVSASSSCPATSPPGLTITMRAPCGG